MTQVAWSTLPPEVATQAAAHDLGGYRQAFEPSKRLRMIVPLVVLVVIFGSVAAIGAAGASSDQRGVGAVFAVVDAALLVAIVWLLLTGPIGSANARARKFY